MPWVIKVRVKTGRGSYEWLDVGDDAQARYPTREEALDMLHACYSLEAATGGARVVRVRRDATLDEGDDLE
jgi:hypothetical protein